MDSSFWSFWYSFGCFAQFTPLLRSWPKLKAILISEGHNVTSRLFHGTVGGMVYFESSSHSNSYTISSPILKLSSPVGGPISMQRSPNTLETTLLVLWVGGRSRYLLKTSWIVRMYWYLCPLYDTACFRMSTRFTWWRIWKNHTDFYLAEKTKPYFWKYTPFMVILKSK